LTQALSFVLAGVQRGVVDLDAAAPPFDKLSHALDEVLAGRDTFFSWREFATGEPALKRDLRRFIQIRPALDYTALEAGRPATDAVRAAAAELGLKRQFGADVRLTGAVPIADDEFSSVRKGWLINGIGTVLVVLAILWLALRSGRIILTVFATLVIGLSLTAALGLLMVGTLNVISIAFAPLFVGVGVDFGIQFSVRYRSERHKVDDLRIALSNAAQRAGVPLTLAAAATAAGFFSFMPTPYRGISELGEIAGTGMIVAFITSITVLPALLRIIKPPGEKKGIGFAWLAPVDRFTETHRTAILIATGAIVLAGLPLLFSLRFDFNPMNLRDPKVESVATYLDLRTDPAIGTSAIDLVAPSVSTARQEEQRLVKLPEVSSILSLDSFIPSDQQQNLAFIRTAAESLRPDFEDPVETAPTDAKNVEALNESVADLTKLAENKSGPGAEAAKRLAGRIAQMAAAPQGVRQIAETVFVTPLKTTLSGLRQSLDAEEITEQTLPSDLKADWVASDGRARIEILPKGDPNDNEIIRNFARAVLAVAPTATGGPVTILEASHTVVGAFLQAGAWALISIATLLWITLRRITDVLLTLVPLLLAAVVTLEICALIGLPLNFANIIALPVLLGIGVAFKIYYIMAWSAGKTGLLQSSLTRAVIFSAMTTATAFGSLWLSSHPGMSSMGKLLALSLVCTLAAAVLFQPVLMGRPRQSREDALEPDQARIEPSPGRRPASAAGRRRTG
jgi:hopanoid biosynthesis associated RND transporter like protein HpnN